VSAFLHEANDVALYIYMVPVLGLSILLRGYQRAPCWGYQWAPCTTTWCRCWGYQFSYTVVEDHWLMWPHDK